MELKKLTEENLTRQPEEVFDILCKLGKGSYGSVYKAIHKDSQQILAIKQVPVDNDLQEIIINTRRQYIPLNGLTFNTSNQDVHYFWIEAGSITLDPYTAFRISITLKLTESY